MDAASDILGLTDLELPADAFTHGGDFQPLQPDVGNVAPPSSPVVPKKGGKKRSRAKPEISGPGVVVYGDRFVCSYSGEFTTHAVFIPGVDSASFHNLPCAFAFLDECGAAHEIIEKYKQATLEAYEQPADNCVRAPDRTKLYNFGGDEYYNEWIGDLCFWDKHALLNGTTVPDYKSQKRGKGSTATKRGSGSNARVSFEAAPYVVSYAKGPAGCRIINELDGSAQDPLEEGEVRDAKKTMSMVRALRKLKTFCTSHAKDGNFSIASTEGDGYYSFFIAAADKPSPKLKNHIATQILNLDAYGPAVMIFMRKYSQRI